MQELNLKHHDNVYKTSYETNKIHKNLMDKHTLQYKLLLTTQWNTNILYNWPSFYQLIIDRHLCMNLLEYVNKGHIAMHTILLTVTVNLMH